MIMMAKKNDGDSWMCDVSSNQLLRRRDKVRAFGDAVLKSGDVIAVGIDFTVQKETICFFLNGQRVGEGFQQFSNANAAHRISPFISLSRNAKVVVNFGRSAFLYPISGYLRLFTAVSPAQINQLDKIFQKYRDIRDEEENDTSANTIQGNGLVQFLKDVGVVDESTDPAVLIIGWRICADSPFEITRNIFVHGFASFGCSSVDGIADKLLEWKKTLIDATVFRPFYNQLFEFLRGERRILEKTEALQAWDTVLKPRNWPLYNHWHTFVSDDFKENAINKDYWEQLFEFIQAYPKDLKSYDPMASSWPTIIDEFYEYMNSR